MLRCSTASAGCILRAKHNAFHSFPLLLLVQQMLPGCLLHARLVFAALAIENKMGRLSASRACSPEGPSTQGFKYRAAVKREHG